jgi:hypothetical protein
MVISATQEANVGQLCSEASPGPIWKMAKVVEGLPTQHEAWVQNHSTTKRKENELGSALWQQLYSH